jgi:hypothetical protein
MGMVGRKPLFRGTLFFVQCASNLKAEAACFLEISVFIYKTAWCHMLEDHSLNSLCCENLKILTPFSVFLSPLLGSLFKANPN